MDKEKAFRLVLVAALVFLIYQFGFRPIFNRGSEVIKADRKYWSELLPDEEGPVYDVIVYGAEPQGIAAAISSARLGARTLLISEDYDMGGIISRCFIPELEVPLDDSGRMLNGGFLEELHKKTGDCFSPEKYTEAVKELIQAESDLSAIVGSVVTGVNMSGSRIDSIEVLTKDGKVDLSARMYIDASDSGALLELCNVPYFTGSADLGMENRFMPVSLNFGMEPKPGSKVNSRLAGKTAAFSDGLLEYQPIYSSTRLEDPKICFLEDGKVIIRGLQVAGVDVMDGESMQQAYEIAVEEAKNMSRWLSENYVELKDHVFSKAAPALRVRESKHYKGKYMLTVDDIIRGRRFDDTVAMGSHPVMITKFAVSGSFIAADPDSYAIPLGSLVPEGVLNLLMAGPRISVSSLAASSTSAIGTCIAQGEAAGAVAVMCVARNENPAFLDKSHEYFEELAATLKAKKMYLPDRTIALDFGKNWSAEAAKQLLSLGLLAGGSENDLRYDAQAQQKDLAFILINGIYRTDRNSYTPELDAKLRQYINSNNLTFDSMVRMVGELYGIEGDPDTVYKRLCEKNYINRVLRDRIEKLETNAETITMDMVYYIGAYSIRCYTGKDLTGVVQETLFVTAEPVDQGAPSDTGETTGEETIADGTAGG
ncbi:MAG TPA: FAD-dependent oxidoreductase [Clostridiales bacterium]|nr:FAD-dependent oxidoreductase [Clostridiales bacterium]HPV01098.1 FAD-dependent oxidoreductase [Clostridiales bacterium]